MVHRLGRLEIGETSVLIVVASAHRSAAFEACRWLIDTLKQTVPIWKKETFADGAVWAPGEPFPKEIAVDGPDDSQSAGLRCEPGHPLARGMKLPRRWARICGRMGLAMLLALAAVALAAQDSEPPFTWT